MENTNPGGNSLELNNAINQTPEPIPEESRNLLTYLEGAKKRITSYMLGETMDRPIRPRSPTKDSEDPQKKKDAGQDPAETKSISTSPSMENFFLDSKNKESNLYSQNVFKCEETQQFCQSVGFEL